MRKEKIEEEERQTALKQKQQELESQQKEKEMLEKAGKRQSALNKQDELLNIDIARSVKQQEVAEKMLQHANDALIKAVDKEDIVAIKVAKEFVSNATKQRMSVPENNKNDQPKFLLRERMHLK